MLLTHNGDQWDIIFGKVNPKVIIITGFFSTLPCNWWHRFRPALLSTQISNRSTLTFLVCMSVSKVQYSTTDQLCGNRFPPGNKIWTALQLRQYLPATIPLSPTELPPTAAAAPVFSIHGRGKGFLKPIFLESIIFVVVPQPVTLYTEVSYVWLPCGLNNAVIFN